MHEVVDYLRQAVEQGASDIFIGAGHRLAFKKDGSITVQGDTILDPVKSKQLLSELYDLAGRQMQDFAEMGDDDFPVSVPNLARFRINAFMQRGTMAAVIRVVLFGIPDFMQMKISFEVMKIAAEKNGLVLVTGSAGSGKSTTLACIIDAVNTTRSGHIITLEDPIEFLHRDAKSIVSQREISIDTQSYLDALRACLRQAPDLILLGEMRDHETIKTAMTAAETGHLLISTLHTTGAVNTIDRIIDVFPPEQQSQVRMQLSTILRTVVSQQLLPDKNGGLVPAFEIMYVNSAIRNLIREGKTHQIDGVIQTSSREGMISLDAYILKLYKDGDITAETAISQSTNHEQMERRLEDHK
jgi:twitching motility protein PilT